MEKDTDQLTNELRETDDVEKFLAANTENFSDLSLANYLRKLLTEKNLVKAQVIRDSLLDEGYAKKIFRGDTIQPARKKILSLALAMKLSPKETDYLLYYANQNKLYSRNPWDDVILFALENQWDVATTNEKLKAWNMETLI